MANVQHTWRKVRNSYLYTPVWIQFQRGKIWHQGAKLTAGYLWCGMHVEEASRTCFYHFGLRPYLLYWRLLAEGYCGTVLLFLCLNIFHLCTCEKRRLVSNVLHTVHKHMVHMDDRWFCSSTMASHKSGVDSGVDAQCYCVYAWFHAWYIFQVCIKAFVRGSFSAADEFIYSNRIL